MNHPSKKGQKFRTSFNDEMVTVEKFDLKDGTSVDQINLEKVNIETTLVINKEYGGSSFLSDSFLLSNNNTWLL